MMFIKMLRGKHILKQYEEKTQRVLRKLGVNGSYTGFYYMAYGIVEDIKDPELSSYICKGLYTTIAEHFHVSISNVERNIRTIVDIIWEHGDRKLLNEIFDKELSRKPKNAEFVDALSQYILNICGEQG